MKKGSRIFLAGGLSAVAAIAWGTAINRGFGMALVVAGFGLVIMTMAIFAVEGPE